MQSKSTPSVLLVSASMGAGHDGVAHELARRLALAGVQVAVVDYLTLLPLRFGAVYRRVYSWQLRRLPDSYEWLYSAIDKPGPLDHVARFLCSLGRRRLRRVVHRGGYTLAVATYPMATQALGRLRRRGLLRAHAVTFLTDADVHTLWLHRAIDLNLTVWPISAAAAAERVDVPATSVGPVLPPDHARPVTAAERRRARARLGLTGHRVALVAAGSWGVGDVLSTARQLAESGVATPVVLCGRNEALRQQLEEAGIGRAIGWTSEVRGFLAAADVVVHNAGGLAALEACAAGIPVIGYACIPGHGRRNAVAMEQSGSAAYAHDAPALLEAVRALAGTPAGAAMADRALALFASDPTEQLREIAGRPVPAARRSRSVRLAAGVTALATVWASLTAGVAEATNRGVGVARGHSGVYVAVLVDAGVSANPGLARLLRQVHASVAVSPGAHAPCRADITRLVRGGTTVVGVDYGTRESDPSEQGKSLIAAARAVRAATGEPGPHVAVLHRLNPVELTVAWAQSIRLAKPGVQVRPGARLPALQPGDQVVFDERGRTLVQIGADLARLRDVRASIVPLRELWPA